MSRNRREIASLGALSTCLPLTEVARPFGARICKESLRESPRGGRSWETLSAIPVSLPLCVGTEFGEGDATTQKLVKMIAFHRMRARHSVNEGFGKELDSKDNSVKRSGPGHSVNCWALKSGFFCAHPLLKSRLQLWGRHGSRQKTSGASLPKPQNRQPPGVRKRVVSKRVVLADASLYQKFLHKVFPCSECYSGKRESYDVGYRGSNSSFHQGAAKGCRESHLYLNSRAEQKNQSKKKSHEQNQRRVSSKSLQKVHPKVLVTQVLRGTVSVPKNSVQQMVCGECGRGVSRDTVCQTA